MRPAPRRRAVTPAVLVVIVVVLLAAAAVASAAAAGERGDAVTLRVPDAAGVGDALVLAGIVAGFILLVAGLLTSGPVGSRRGGSNRRALIALLTCLLVALALMQLVGTRDDGTEDGTDPEATEGAEVDGDGDAADGRSASTADLLLVFGVIAVGVAVAVVAATRAGQSGVTSAEPGNGAGPAAAARALSDLLDEAIDELRAAADPRLAVIAAYDRMERVLAGHGRALARRPAEAPLEYLVRVLAVLDTSAPAAGRLTALFERAMFSAGPVERPMQDDAIEALVAVRDELRALR